MPRMRREITARSTTKGAALDGLRLSPNRNVFRLLDRDLDADLLELGLDLLGVFFGSTFLDRLGVFFGSAFLDRLGRAFDHVLGVLEAETRDRTDFLDV